jgi:transposase-like protein
MAFTPPFCPYSDCQQHHRDNHTALNWFSRNGQYHCLRTGITQRYRCTHCRRTFSQNSFHLDFRTHQRLDYRRIFSSINSSSGIRDIAREFHVTDKVILNRLGRLARQAMGIMAELSLGHLIDEDIAIDGFESFVHSQYWPNNFTLAVGSTSQVVYACDYAQLRRKGRMTPAQKRRRDQLNRTYPIAGKQVERSFTDVIDALLPRWRACVGSGEYTLHTDCLGDYARVLRGHQDWKTLENRGQLSHRQTSSKIKRTTDNPLFPVNYLDREIRKDQACHVRQTVQWSRSVNNAMERMMIYIAYHNLFKPYRIKDNSALTHGEVGGFDRMKIRALKRRMFTRRFFVHHLVLDISQWKTWHRIWKTPVFEMKIDSPAFAVA